MDTVSDTSIASPDIYLTKDWAKYLMKHMGMVKRRASRKAKTTVINFDELKETFLQDIKRSMLMDEIPPELIINLGFIMSLYPHGVWKWREQRELKW